MQKEVKLSIVYKQVNGLVTELKLSGIANMEGTEAQFTRALLDIEQVVNENMQLRAHLFTAEGKSEMPEPSEPEVVQEKVDSPKCFCGSGIEDSIHDLDQEESHMFVLAV